MFKRFPDIGVQFKASKMSPRFVLGRENVPCVAEVVNRSLKADCTDFIVHSLSSGKVEMFLCAACHAFPPHVECVEALNRYCGSSLS